MSQLLRRNALLALCVSVLALAQRNTPPTQFQMASIRSSMHNHQTEVFLPSLYPPNGATLLLSNLPLRTLLTLAYQVSDRQIIGPAWISHDRFDVTVTLPVGTARGQAEQMLQGLLTEKFAMTSHQEQDILQVFVLEVAGRGSKLRESSSTSTGIPGCSGSFKRLPEMHLVITCHRVDSTEIAEQIETIAAGYLEGRPIVDLTGLNGLYDFALDSNIYPDETTDQTRTALFQAIEQQLGLFARPSKRKLDVIVVDHIDRKAYE